MLGVICGDYVVTGLSFSAVEGKNACKHFQQCRFASSIRPDQSNSVSPRKRKIQPSIYHVIAVRLAYICECYDF